MGKAKIRKQIRGYQLQLKKHGLKYMEAKARGAETSMSYMKKEMVNYSKRLGVLKRRLRPKRAK